ncbi:MAG: bifunctional [glutamate--ammonia ligase]-adenylyl-L-tyrosine phosphorylase/[glutamate--ammonia-ligase] adenylyltransferase [Deltaproteobacteria bacterium]
MRTFQLPDKAVPIPDGLKEAGKDRLHAFLASADAARVSVSSLPIDCLERVFAVSDFVAQAAIRDPSIFCGLFSCGYMDRSMAEVEYGRILREALANEMGGEDSLMRALRRLRRREMVRIAWRDLTGVSSLYETMGELSGLARSVLDVAVSRLQDELVLRFGAPCGVDGSSQSLVVFGLGKLGAGELNFSSDIDLVFAYPESGETRGGKDGVSNHEFFDRLVRRLIRIMGAATEEGFVFRVDTRLRPFGEAGPLVMSFDGLLDYYEIHGREWERYAWIKAGVAAGDRTAGERFLEDMRPFVYRRYLDFGAFDAIRDMKGMIAKEARKKGLLDNIKLGSGGIREIEFLCQTFQLIHGGRDPGLRARAVLHILPALADRGLLSGQAASGLAEAYVFLRMVENRLQEYADQQTQELPSDDLGRLRLAFSLGYEGWEDFHQDLQRHRHHVSECFERLVLRQRCKTVRGSQKGALGDLWHHVLEGEEAELELAGAGFEDPARALRIIRDLWDSSAVRAASAIARQRLDRLMPALLLAVAGTERPTDVLLRMARIVEVIARRSVYVSLLVENPEVLSRLVSLCAQSSWIATQVSRFPILLDELIAPESLFAPLSREALEKELALRLGAVPPEDEELVMDELRRFRLGNVLRVAVEDITGVTPLMRVSDHLTDIAEVVLAAACDLAWDYLVHRHGRPPTCSPAGGQDGKGFLVVAYGKFGGIELGYGSDLDLVFIHAGEPGTRTPGPRPLETSLFYARLGQRILHILTTRTSIGTLYPVDMRLRPSGEAGLLVSRMDAFADYQRKDAWTWEHQALVRARPVAGDERLAESFSELRQEILTRPRDPSALREEVRGMRARMATGRKKTPPGLFDLKHDPGGIVDIEFLVQFFVLSGANRFPAIARWTDNVRILEEVAKAGMIPNEKALFLRDSYLLLRSGVHRSDLREEPPLVPEREFEEIRQGVKGIWREILGDG